MKIKKIFVLPIFIFFIFTLTYLFSQAGRGIGRISGVVVDEKGKPVPDAQVIVSFTQNENLKHETKTNKKGEWAIAGLGTGGWLIRVTAGGYLPETQQVFVRQLEKNPRMTITLKKVINIDATFIQDESSFGLFEKGNQLFSEQKYDEAITSFEKFLEKNPNAYQTYLNIGNCYREKGELEKAIEYFNKALENTREDERLGKEVGAKALAGIGNCYLKKGDFEKAQDFFRQSIEMSPDNEILAYNVGEIYFSNQKVEEAIHYFELAAQIKPDWSDSYLKLGYAYLNRADNAKALESFEKFLKLEPDSERSLMVTTIIEAIKKK